VADETEYEGGGSRVRSTAQGATESVEASAALGTGGKERSITARRLIDVGVIIAVAGLLFSGVTYFFNRRDQHQADQRQARTELTEVVSRIAALPRQYAELKVTPPTGGASDDLSGLFRHELAVLVSQAEQLVSEHPSIAGPADFFTIGSANANLSNYESAVANYAAAKHHAVAVGDPLLAASSRAAAGEALFALEKFDKGREMFRRAITQLVAALPRVEAELHASSVRTTWASAELRAGNCAAAEELVEELDSTDDPTASESAARLRPQIETACSSRPAAP
jgi:hypothetical protein